MANYGVTKLRTTAGLRYILTRGGQVSHSFRTYYKTKSNAMKKANQLNKNL